MFLFAFLMFMMPNESMFLSCLEEGRNTEINQAEHAKLRSYYILLPLCDTVLLSAL